jgi:hypothetical protein
LCINAKINYNAHRLPLSRVTMEIDINIVAHDLLWRRMSIRRKQEYVKSWGALKDKLVKDEMVRLIDDGYAIQHDDDLELLQKAMPSIKE